MSDLSVWPDQRPGQAAGARPRDRVGLAVNLSEDGTLVYFLNLVTFSNNKGSEVDLPDVLLVVEDLLVAAAGPVLHVSQAADPAAHLELHFLIVNLK